MTDDETRQAVERGMLVRARTADGKWVVRRAASGAEDLEHDFPVVWLTWPDADPNDPAADVWPWPVEDVEPLAGGAEEAER